jgi:hypothetical protein
MSKRQQRIERIRGIEAEFLAASTAVRLLARQLQTEPGLAASEGWRARDARNLKDNLEATYLIRLYAEFESGLRDAWANWLRRDTHPPMRDLLVAIANQRIAQDWLDAADEVRQYRNVLVHEGDVTQVTLVPLPEARGRLCRFLSGLPVTW